MIYFNGSIVEFNKYPNGEIYNTSFIRPDLLRCNVTFKYETDEDIVHLIFFKKHLDHYAPDKYSTLDILYLPYSRLDRPENGFMFTLKYLCEIINGLHFNKVIVHEPHSDVSTALLDNCEIVWDSIDIYKENRFAEFSYIYFPDASAEKRYAKHFLDKKHLVGIKKREFSTGKITDLTILGDMEKDSNVLLVDDLASRGGTFLMGAKKLKEMGAKTIYLIVGHCENTIHDGELLKTDFIDRIYTTNSIITKPHDKIVIKDIIER